MSLSMTLDFAAKMAARRAAAEATMRKTDVAVVENPNLISVRRFNKSGIKRLEELLADVRRDKQLYDDEMAELLTDPEYSEEIKEPYKIDPTRVFATKLELCKYFVDEVFPSTYLESSDVRNDSGLWTWIALAYYKQFAKKVKDIVRLNADSCWVFNPFDYRFGRRHYVAGSVYLYLDVREFGADALDMLFLPPPTEFGRLIDAMTNVRDSVRTPAFLGVALSLYFDASKKTKYASAAIDQNGPGSIRQLTRVIQQFRETYDFTSSDSVDVLRDKLPSQFDQFLKAK